MRQTGQLLMFSDAEINVLKGAFADNEDLIYAVRKVLLQGELSDTEKSLVKGFITEPVFKVVKKRFLPELDLDLPLGQLSNFAFSIQEKMKSGVVEDLDPVFDAVVLEQTYLEERFNILQDIEKTPVSEIVLSSLVDLVGKDARTRFVNLTAFNFITSYVDGMLMHIKTMAGKKEESIEDTKKRLQRDSAK